MSSGSSVVRAMMLRDAAAAQQRVRGAEYAARASARSGAARPRSAMPASAASLYLPSISPASSGSTEQGFSDVLAMASMGSPALMLPGLRDQRMLGQRSSMLPPATGPLWNTSSGAASAQVSGRNDGLTATEAVPYSDLIASMAKKYNVSPSLVAAVVRAESGFDPKAVSKAGAKGLMQLMDDTARTLGVTDPFNPNQNIDGGTRFLSGLLKRYNGNTTLALAAYNAGEGAVEKYAGIPPYKETKDFVSSVLGYWRQFAEVFRA